MSKKSKILSIFLAYFCALNPSALMAQGPLKYGNRALNQPLCLQGNVAGTLSDALCVKGNSTNVGLGTQSAARQFHILNSATAYQQLQTSTSGQYAGTEYVNPGKTWTVGVEGLADSFVITDSAGFGSSSNYAIEIPKATSVPKFRNGITFGGDTLSTVTSGTCTPAFVPGTGSYTTVTYSAQNCDYVRIGRIVYLRASMILSAFSVGTGSGQLKVTLTGAPAPLTTGSHFMSMPTDLVENITYPANSTAGGQTYCLIINGNGSACFPYAARNSTTGTTPSFDATSLSSTTRFEFSGTYMTD